MSTTLIEEVDVLEVARIATAAAFAARLAAVSAIEQHDDCPSQYRAGVAAEMIGLYGHLIAAETAAWASTAKRSLR